VPFYFKHLDEHLILKRIRLMPSLSKSLSGAVDETIKSLNDQGISIPSSIGGLMPRHACKDYLRMVEPMVDARSVAEFYRDLTAKSCQSVASTLLLHPRADYWFYFRRPYSFPSPLPFMLVLLQCLFLPILSVYNKTWTLCNRIYESRKSQPMLGHRDFYHDLHW
jgi:hypothetical protein